MKVQTVKGVEVVHDAPAETPISRPDRPVHFKQIRRLELANGDVAYGCIHCEYTADSSAKVRPHLKVHKPAKPAASLNGLAGMTVQELMSSIDKVNQLQHQNDFLAKDRDNWRARALKAERSLGTLRKVLNP